MALTVFTDLGSLLSREQRAEKVFQAGLSLTNSQQQDAAITAFSETIRLNPNHAQAYFRRGRIFRKKGALEKADADFAKAKELGYEPD